MCIADGNNIRRLLLRDGGFVRHIRVVSHVVVVRDDQKGWGLELCAARGWSGVIVLCKAVNTISSVIAGSRVTDSTTDGRREIKAIIYGTSIRAKMCIRSDICGLRCIRHGLSVFVTSETADWATSSLIAPSIIPILVLLVENVMILRTRPSLLQVYK